jgi:hypothetical protein
MNKKIFNDFEEYWSFVKTLNDTQKNIISSALSKEEYLYLKQSYEEGGWHEVLMKNLCEHYLDHIKEKFGIDVLEIKMKTISGKPQLVNKNFWYFVKDYFKDIPKEYSGYIFSGYSEVEDGKYIRLIKNREKNV